MAEPGFQFGRFAAAVCDDENSYLRSDSVDPCVEQRGGVYTQPELFGDFPGDADVRRLGGLELATWKLPLVAFVLQQHDPAGPDDHTLYGNGEPEGFVVRRRTFDGTHAFLSRRSRWRATKQVSSEGRRDRRA